MKSIGRNNEDCLPLLSNALSDFAPRGGLISEMPNKSDAQLLRDYAAQHSEPAFAEIVARHTDLVYSAALRQTGSPELAREIAQSVFTDLARKARALVGTLSADASLAGWLFRSTRFAGLKLLRDDHRRQTRERQFMEHFHPAAQAATDSAPDWQRVAPVLDEAMAELDDADHEAVLLRYFKNQDFHAVGLALGVSDDAAQKRVRRAVDRLREFLVQRGVTTGPSGLVVLISANGVLTAPTGLSAAIAATALAGTTVLTAATVTVAKAIAMTTMQKVLVAAAFAAAVGMGIYEAREASRARDLNGMLQQQQAALNEQIQQLTRERDEASRRLATNPNDTERLNRAADELLKLRGAVARLRASSLPNGGDPTQTAAQGWVDRVNQLKGYLEQHSEEKIPELQFINDDGWLRVTIMGVNAQTNGLADGGYHRQMVWLRQLAKMKFSELAGDALRKYASAHRGQFPTDLAQLKPYFNPPVDDAILQRYAILPRATFGDIRATGDWVIAEITSPDEDLDYRYVTSAGGSDAMRFKQPRSGEEIAQMNAQIQSLIPTLEPAMKGYAAAHEGIPPPSEAPKIEQLIPYATTSEQQSAIQKIIELQKEVLSFVSPTRHLIPQPANNGK